MALPDQIKNQIKEADKIRKEMDENPTPVRQSPPLSVVENEPPAPAETEQATAAESAPAPAPEQMPPQQPSEVMDRGVSEAQTPDQNLYEQRFKTLQGKYDAEVPRLHQQNRALENELARLKQMVESLSQPSYARAPLPGEISPLTPEEVEIYDQDMVKMAQRANAPLYDGFGKVSEKLDQIGAQLAQTQAYSFEGHLNAQVPDWQKTNQDPAFLEWLGQVDPMTGATRQQWLDDAVTKQDAGRAVHFFKAFQSQQGSHQPPSAVGAAQPERAPPRQRSAKLDLATQVAPGRPAPVAGQSGAENGSDNKPIYTSQQVAQFQADVASGKYNRHMDEVGKIADMIQQAYIDGRVRNVAT